MWAILKRRLKYFKEESIWAVVRCLRASTVTVRHLLAHGFLLVHVSTLPPLGEEGDLRPNELPAWVLSQLDQHVVEDVLRLICVVLIKRLDPACRDRRSQHRGDEHNNPDQEEHGHLQFDWHGHRSKTI